MESMNTILSHSKSLVKVAVDTCILPGTTCGTEILYLYLIQWKKELSTLFFAFLSILFAQFNSQIDVRTIPHHSFNENENVQ
jgi:hypothetical protein